MQSANDSSRRPSARLPRTSSTNEVATSNSTTNHFLGTQQRSWMRQGMQNPGELGTTTMARLQNAQRDQTYSRTTSKPISQQGSSSVSSATTSSLQPTSSVPTTYTAPSQPAPQNVLPSYQFVSTARPTPPEEPSSLQNALYNQEQGGNKHPLQHPDGNQQIRQGLESHISHDKEPANANRQIEVVDLTASQDVPDIHQQQGQFDQQEQEQEQEQGSRASPQETMRHDYVVHSTSAPHNNFGGSREVDPSVTNAVPHNRPVVSTQLPQGHLSPPLPPPSSGQPAMGQMPNPKTAGQIGQNSNLGMLPANLRQLPSVLSPLNTMNNNSPNQSVAYNTTPGQLLTPAASPLNQFNSHLQRKRPLDDASVQQPQLQPRSISKPTHILPSNQSPPPGVSVHIHPHYGDRNVVTSYYAPPGQQNQHQQYQQYSYQQSQYQSPNVGHPQSSLQNHLMQDPGRPYTVLPHTTQHGQQNRRVSQARPRGHQHQSSSSAAVQTPTRGQSYLATFDSTIAEMGQRIDISGAASNLRIPWIRDACQQNDLFFLLLNQLYCTWYLNRKLATSLGLASDCNAGFDVLELLFASNKQLPGELVAFLAGWPNSTYSLQASPELKLWISNIAKFLPQLGLLWEGFRQMCLHRKLPPISREILERFQCPTSVILPRAIFSSLDRQIHPSAPASFQSAAFDLFIQNQKAYYARLFPLSNQVVTPPLPTTEEVRIFAGSYQHFLARYLRSADPTLEAPETFAATAYVRSRHQSLNNPSQIQVANPVSQTPLRPPGAIQTPQRSTTDPTRTSSSGHQRSLNATTVPQNSVQHSISGSETLQNQSRGVTANQSNNMQFFQVDGGGPIPNVQVEGHSSNVLSMSPILIAPNRAPMEVPSNHITVVKPNIPSQIPQRLLPDLANLPPFLTNPVPEQEALHQAHLRQPVTQIQKTYPDETARLYQFIDGFSLRPHLWKTDDSFLSLDFDIPPELDARKGEITHPASDSFRLPKRVLSANSVLFNLRCIQVKPTSEMVDEFEWSALPTYWPQHIFVSINNQHLEIRRKRQHKRDLPIDVTPFVLPGQNNVKMSVHAEKGDEGKKYGIAVEVVGLRNIDQVRNMPEKISYDESLKGIMQLMQPATDSDDDMQVINDSITLSMTDPFLSSMFTIPVRGKTCKHRECFDLETFLQSRTSDNKDALTSVYQWQCPTCGKDTRPSSLIIDGFLQEVRDKLVADGNNEARAIIVKANGTWVVKPDSDREESNGPPTAPQRDEKIEHSIMADDHRAPSIPPTGAGLGTDVSAQLTGGTSVIEIIELDDD